MSTSNTEAPSYHGYGPEGYIPGPHHGRLSNLDHAAQVQETRERASSPGDLVDERRRGVR